jgi:hypothetical protein
MSDVATVVPVPDGGKVVIHTGVLAADGTVLARPDGEKDTFVMTGVLILTSPVERVGYGAAIVTGVVLAPRGSEAALAAGLTRHTGVLSYYDYEPGQTVRVFQGDNRLGGSGLANAGGDPTGIAIVTGQLVLTSPVTAVGFQRVIVAGQIAAPRESQELLEPLLTVMGQAVWYTGTARSFSGTQRFTRAFFELLDDPVTLILSGSFELDHDVPAALLKAKVESIALSGQLLAGNEALPMAQVLTTAMSGKIGPLEAGS